MRLTATAAILCLATAAPTLAGSLTLIPIPPGLEGYVFNTGVSGDARMVAGYAPSGGFYWTPDTGVVYIADALPPGNGAGGTLKVSDDGTRICAAHRDLNGKAIGAIYQPLDAIWIDEPGLGSNCDITRTSAWTLSRDGLVMGGLGYGPTLCNVQPTRWQVGSATTLGLFRWFGWNARVNGCNANGSVMCGWQAGATGGPWQGCFWKFNGTSWAQTRLSTAAGVSMGEAQCVSDDGSRVFGVGSFTSGYTEPYVWTAANKAVSLGATPQGGYTQGFVVACNASGTQACVFFRPGPTPLPVGEGYMWIDGQGYVGLEAYAASKGVAVPQGVHLAMPLDMSGDGLAFCGVARNDTDGLAYTFVLDLHGSANTCPADLNGDRIVDGADLGLLLGNWGGSGIGDINQDGTVNGADLGLLLGAYGACP
jgi:hypothetical protein